MSPRVRGRPRAGGRPRAELLVTGRIATLEGDAGMGWVEALAISNGGVLAHGRLEDLEGLVGPGTRRLALGPEEAAIPALADAHLHLLDAALADERVDISGLSADETLDRIGEAHRGSRDPDAWLEGDGWDPDGWGIWPDAGDLERVAPGRRAAFWAHDRHSLWVSERALAEAAITADREDPSGGMIRRRVDGRPSGVLHETAAALILARIPAPSTERRREAVARLSHRLVAAGLGSIHDPGAIAADAGLAGVEVYRDLDAAGRLPIRVHASIRRESLAAAIKARLRSGDGLGGEPTGEPTNARCGWLKLFADGTLGSRTAAMLEPFEEERTGESDGRGMFQVPPEELAALVARAAAAGIATQIHAIGDAAVRAALDALARSGRRPPALAPRIEHAQLVDPTDMTRFATLGVVASVQPAHIGTDAATARLAWGVRAARAYPYASIRRAGGILAFGTDAPIEPWDPWPGLEQAVTRRSASWSPKAPALAPSEALDLAEALRAATIGPALAATRSDEDRSVAGRLVAGGRADLLVVDAAALATPVTSGGPLGRTRPRLVLLAGREIASR